MNEPQRPQPPRAPYAPPTSPVSPPVVPAHVPQPYQSAASRVVPGDYSTAPSAVKAARIMAMLCIVVGAVMMMFPFSVNNFSSSETMLLVMQGALYVGMGGWLAYAHYHGQFPAWVGQIVLSVLVIGIAVLSGKIVRLSLVAHVILLTQWFSPEVKAWFEVE